MNRKLNTSFNDSLIPKFALRLFSLESFVGFLFFSYLFRSFVNIDTLEHFQLYQLRSLLNWRKSFATNSRFTKLCCNIQIKCLLHSNMNGQRFKNIYGAVFTICEGVLNIKHIVRVTWRKSLVLDIAKTKTNKTFRASKHLQGTLCH